MIEQLSPAQRALLGYMEGESEKRWCAGWYSGLHEALRGDVAYEWLVERAGGTFAWNKDGADGEPVEPSAVGGDDLVWIEQPDDRVESVGWEPPQTVANVGDAAHVAIALAESGIAPILDLHRSEGEAAAAILVTPEMWEEIAELVPTGDDATALYMQHEHIVVEGYGP